MSLAWLLAVSGLMAAEKLLPGRRVARVGVAVVLVAVAVGEAVPPASVPWLTVSTTGQITAHMWTKGQMTGHM